MYYVIAFLSEWELIWVGLMMLHALLTIKHVTALTSNIDRFRPTAVENAKSIYIRFCIYLFDYLFLVFLLIASILISGLKRKKEDAKYSIIIKCYLFFP